MLQDPISDGDSGLCFPELTSVFSPALPSVPLVLEEKKPDELLEELVGLLEEPLEDEEELVELLAELPEGDELLKHSGSEPSYTPIMSERTGGSPVAFSIAIGRIKELNIFDLALLLCSLLSIRISTLEA